MAKLSAELVATLSLLLVVSHVAMAHRATVHREYEEERRGESCRGEIEKQDLRHCERYLVTRCGGGGTEEEDVADGPATTRHLIRSCCHRLRQMEEGCWCQEMRMIVREQKRKRTSEEMEEIVRAARDLMSICGVAPQRCEIRAVWF